MKPDSNPPGFPYNFNSIPLWLKPDLWDETKEVRFRGLFFIILYTFSVAVFGAILFVPAGIYKGIAAAGVTVILWLVLSFGFGIPLGFLAWWDFIRRRRKMVAEAAESPPSDHDLPKGDG